MGNQFRLAGAMRHEHEKGYAGPRAKQYRCSDDVDQFQDIRKVR